MSVEKAARREIEKKDEESRGITAEEKEDYIDERTAYRNEYDEKLEKQITTDELTGLANRHGFMNELERTLESMRQPRSPLSEERRSKEQVAPALEEFSLLFINLDNFKRINDALGHDAGDNALIRFAEILKKSIRKGSIEARLHGDEFAVFLPRTGEAAATAAAENVLKNLESDPELNKFGVSASIGVRHVDTSNLTEEMTSKSLTDEADMQQLKAKKGGKGRVEVYA